MRSMSLFDVVDGSFTPHVSAPKYWCFTPRCDEQAENSERGRTHLS